MRVFEPLHPEAAHAQARPLPAVDRDSAPYWAGAAEGRLRLQRCEACDAHQFYPRALCVRCAGPVGWVDASGEGVVHTFTVVRQNLAPPFGDLGAYVVAMVELPEGVRLMGNVTHVAPEDVHVGLAVTAYAVRIREDLGIPFWRPRGAASSDDTRGEPR